MQRTQLLMQVRDQRGEWRAGQTGEVWSPLKKVIKCFSQFYEPRKLCLWTTHSPLVKTLWYLLCINFSKIVSCFQQGKCIPGPHDYPGMETQVCRLQTCCSHCSNHCPGISGTKSCWGLTNKPKPQLALSVCWLRWMQNLEKIMFCFF